MLNPELFKNPEAYQNWLRRQEQILIDQCIEEVMRVDFGIDPYANYHNPECDEYWLPGGQGYLEEVEGLNQWKS